METIVARQSLETALTEAMNDASKREMQWSVDDCAIWCANIIRRALGYDPAERFRVMGYSTQEGAQKALGSLGLGFALKESARKHGWKRIKPEDSQVGDIGLAISGQRPATFICRAPGWFVARNEHGFTAIESKFIRLAWSVIN